MQALSFEFWRGLKAAKSIQLWRKDVISIISQRFDVGAG